MKVRGFFLVLVSFACASAWAVYSDNDLRMLRSERALLDDRTPVMPETPGVKPAPATNGRSPSSIPDTENPAKNPALDGKDFRLRIWDR